MISESHPWRRELLKIAERLERKTEQSRWPEQSFYLVERDLILGAFSVRRLMESFKVPDSIRAASVPVDEFERVGAIPDAYNRHEIWKHFDLTHPRSTRLSVRDLCNQFIHSWLLQLSFREGDTKFDGVYVASERQRHARLFRLEADEIVALFRLVAVEDVVAMRMERDPVTGEFAVVELRGPSDCD